MLEVMGFAAIFSTLDLRKGYYQVPVTPRHVEKTALVTEWGKYEFLVMPVRVRNAPATFQCLMDIVLQEVRTFSRCYIDDICIFSTVWNAHLRHLRAIYMLLRDAGLTLSLSKLRIPWSPYRSRSDRPSAVQDQSRDGLPETRDEAYDFHGIGNVLQEVHPQLLCQLLCQQICQQC